jgi:hypothetical protein
MKDDVLMDSLSERAIEFEKALLQHEAESLRSFFSLTGPARKDYTIQIAEADAIRIRALFAAEADGLLAVRKAEAEGYRLIGEALAAIPNAGLVIEIAKLHALQQVAESLGEGQATKLFIPQSLGGLFSLLGSAKEIVETPNSQTTESGGGTK